MKFLLLIIEITRSLTLLIEYLLIYPLYLCATAFFMINFVDKVYYLNSYSFILVLY